MEALRHKTFVGPTIYLQGGSLNDNREAIRALAEAFVCTVGAKNVVSICEHAMTFRPFSVVVWYRAGVVDSDEAPVVQVSNATIARTLRNGAKQPAPRSLRKEAVSNRRRLWLLLVLIVTFLFVPYVGSYYHLSRRGMEEAKAYHMKGFLYVPADEAFTRRDLSQHYFLMRLYAPLNWLDQTLFGSDGPVRGITWRLSK
jgi:hypothetical protein